MTESMSQLKRIRWGVRAVLMLGVAASIAGNVLHAQDNFVSQVISAWSPLALLLTIELISRVPVHRRGLALARWAATALIAGIAAWVSYWHMAAVAARYGETDASPYLLPLSVDGLVVVASVCLVELAGRIRAMESRQMSASDGPVDAVDHRGPVFDYPVPIGPQLAPKQVVNLTTPLAPARKAYPSAKERVEKAHRRAPDASHKQLAERLKLSVETVRRHRPPREQTTPVNGNVPELEGATK